METTKPNISEKRSSNLTKNEISDTKALQKLDVMTSAQFNRLTYLNVFVIVSTFIYVIPVTALYRPSCYIQKSIDLGGELIFTSPTWNAPGVYVQGLLFLTLWVDVCQSAFHLFSRFESLLLRFQKVVNKYGQQLWWVLLQLVKILRSILTLPVSYTHLTLPTTSRV